VFLQVPQLLLEASRLRRVALLTGGGGAMRPLPDHLMAGEDQISPGRIPSLTHSLSLSPTLINSHLITLTHSHRILFVDPSILFISFKAGIVVITTSRQRSHRAR